MPGERGPRNVPMMPLADFVALSGVGLEPLVEEVRRAHRHELVERVEVLLAQGSEVLTELEQRQRGPRGSATSGSGGIMPMIGLTAMRHEVHQPAELVVRLGVARRVADELAARLVAVAPSRRGSRRWGSA